MTYQELKKYLEGDKVSVSFDKIDGQISQNRIEILIMRSI